MTADPAPLAEQLVSLAETRHDGVLGRPGRRDEIHLRGGRITHVRANGADRPAPASRPGADPAVGAVPAVTAVEALAARESLVDGVRELLGAGAAATGQWRASRNRRPLDLAGVRLGVPAVLAEVARRRAVLERLRGVVTTETPLTRRAELPVAAVRVTPEQWALLALVDGAATPRELAGPLGDSVFRTLCRAYELMRLGLLAAEPAPDPARGRLRPVLLSSG